MGEENQEAVVLAFLADAAAVILEKFDGVFADVAVRLDRRHGGHDDDVAARGLERFGSSDRFCVALARR